ncbi:hypothetical protein KP509_16G059400 [Ceratopteris richardii]|uniref:Glycosyltransferase n=1 Tax=Ceratopteris richardii TaxID=49495 RepID=A0A8T2T0Q5_CERRI|nr:hypothetical protein KP509_16G059400 [Ceratopteris richardii]
MSGPAFITCAGDSLEAAHVHVVLVPLPLQGHLNPFTSLAHYLSASGVDVSIVLAARADTLLSEARGSSSSIPPLSSPTGRPIRIEVVPDGISSQSNRPLDWSMLQQSIETMRQGVENLLEKLMREKYPPRCVVVDSLIPWGRDISLKFNLPWMMLWAGSALGFSIGYHAPELVRKGLIPAAGEEAMDKIVDFVPGLSPFRIRDVPRPILVDDDPQQNPAYQFFMSIFNSLKHADRILVDSIHELESSVVNALREKAGFNLYHVGPLFMMDFLLSAPYSPRASLLGEDDSCLSWLNQQEGCSVLYISFGSMATLEQHVLAELAHGLEASGVNFLWVIRPDFLQGKASIEELLPEGFLERTHCRARLTSWAPQLSVLGHSSVGAFLTHCGWNSVLESLSHGVPMLGFPQQAEQNTNLKSVVEDWRVGMPLLPPNVQKVERAHVQHAVDAIMRGDEGTKARTQAMHLKQVARRALSSSSKSNLEKLVRDLKYDDLKV